MAEDNTDKKGDDTSKEVTDASTLSEGDKNENISAGHEGDPPATHSPARDSFEAPALKKLNQFWEFAKKPESTNVAMAAATVIIAVATVFTYFELRSGSADTQSLAASANLQSLAAVMQAFNTLTIAGATQQQSNRTEDLVNATKNLANAAKIQSDNTATLAKAARDQVIRLTEQVAATNRLAAESERSAKAADDSLDLAKKSLEAQERPWITESAQIGDPVSFDVNGARFTFLFTLDNIGQAPGEAVSIQGEMRNWLAGIPMPEDQRRLCNQTGITSFGETIFRGRPTQDLHVWYIPWSQINTPMAPNVLGAVLYGCVVYTDGISNILHSTPFRYEVVQNDGKLIIQDGGFSVTTHEIPITRLGLRRNPFAFNLPTK